MSIPSPADFRNKTKKHSEVREMLAEMAEGVDSKEEVDQKIETAKEDVLTESEQVSKEIVSQLGIGAGFSDTAVFMIVDSKGRVLPFPQANEKGLPTEASAIAIFNAISSRIVSQINSALSDSGLSFNDANPELLVAIASSSGKRTWLEAGLDGLPTAWSVSAIHEKLLPSITALVIDEMEDVGISEATDPTLLFSLASASGKRTWLEAGLDGLPTAWASKCISDAIGALVNVVPAKVKSSYQSAEIKAVSGPDIICYGDSMTYGAGSDGYCYPIRLKQLLSTNGSSANVFNCGVGGENSATITARSNANPLIVNPFAIPADVSPVNITFKSINGVQTLPLYQGNGHGDENGNGAGLRRYFDGEINGIKGRITLVQPSASGNVYTPAPDDYYTFTRAIAGTEVNVARPSPFYLDYARQHSGDIHLIWIGTNNGDDYQRAISDAKAIINNMQALDKRYLVISRLKSSTAENAVQTYEQLDMQDKAFFSEFGNRFISIRKYMNDWGLQDAGITATAQDLIDIQQGNVPTSLRVDGVHWTPVGYQILANIVFKKLNEFGWI